MDPLVQTQGETSFLSPRETTVDAEFKGSTVCVNGEGGMEVDTVGEPLTTVDASAPVTSIPSLLSLTPNPSPQLSTVPPSIPTNSNSMPVLPSSSSSSSNEATSTSDPTPLSLSLSNALASTSTLPTPPSYHYCTFPPIQLPDSFVRTPVGIYELPFSDADDSYSYAASFEECELSRKRAEARREERDRIESERKGEEERRRGKAVAAKGGKGKFGKGVKGKGGKEKSVGKVGKRRRRGEESSPELSSSGMEDEDEGDPGPLVWKLDKRMKQGGKWILATAADLASFEAGVVGGFGLGIEGQGGVREGTILGMVLPKGKARERTRDTESPLTDLESDAEGKAARAAASAAKMELAAKGRPVPAFVVEVEVRAKVESRLRTPTGEAAAPMLATIVPASTATVHETLEVIKDESVVSAPEESSNNLPIVSILKKDDSPDLTHVDSPTLLPPAPPAITSRVPLPSTSAIPLSESPIPSPDPRSQFHLSVATGTSPSPLPLTSH